ncbi:MAG TPA: cysteine desulfurase [Thermomicrobiales bacterium]|nr:cysteine desulfurase [Thermomicrobiales bacterium]
MTATTTVPLNPTQLRTDFPILAQTHNGHPLAYLDSAASSQKPQVVIDAVRNFYEQDNANVHRGVYALSERATDAYEQARRKVARFFNAPHARQIIFTRNTTEALNLVANSWGRWALRPGDTVLISELEHHSNIVPWQLVCQATGATLDYIAITDDGRLQLDDLDRHLATGRVRMVSLCHVSNVTGTINPVEEIIARAHAAGVLVTLDGAQAAPHLPVDLTALDVDFYACSGHKMCAPMGAGVLYGRRELLEAMPPFLGGGSMIRQVGLQSSTWADLPEKFEAGTPNVADAIGLGVACDYLSAIGLDAIHAHEQALTRYALDRLSDIPGLTLFGPPAEHRCGVAAFTLDGVHPHDIGSILDETGVCVRAGHHCTQPLHARFAIDASARASFYLYNTQEDIDRLIDGLARVQSIFGIGG